MFKVCRCAHERTFAFRHLFATHGQESVYMNFRRQLKSRYFQHAWPEQGMKVRDVFADKVMNLSVRILPPLIKVFFLSLAPFFRGRHVTDRRVKPYVPIVAGAVGDLETKIGGWA